MKSKKKLVTELTQRLTSKDKAVRKKTICDFGKLLAVKSLEPLCNIALFDVDERVRVITLSVIADVIRKYPRLMESYTFRVFVIHNVLNSFNKFPTLNYVNSVNWFLSAINLTYGRKESQALRRTILGKRDVLPCNKDLKNGITSMSKIILSNVKKEKIAMEYVNS